MENHRKSRKITENHGKSRKITENHGRVFQANHGNSRSPACMHLNSPNFALESARCMHSVAQAIAMELQDWTVYASGDIPQGFLVAASSAETPPHPLFHGLPRFIVGSGMEKLAAGDDLPNPCGSRTAVMRSCDHHVFISGSGSGETGSPSILTTPSRASAHEHLCPSASQGHMTTYICWSPTQSLMASLRFPC